MGRQGKVVKYELEEFVLDLRAKGKTAAYIKGAVNDELEHRDVADSVTTRSIERYLTTLDAATVPVAHQPQVAERNAGLVFDVAGRLGLLDGYLVAWIEQANLAVRPVEGVVYDTVGQRMLNAVQLGAESSEDFDGDLVVQVYEVDWQARKAASSELRQAAEAIATLIGRIHDAEQVRAFQESVQEAIREASPDVANAVIEKLEKRQSVVRASLLGAAA